MRLLAKVMSQQKDKVVKKEGGKVVVKILLTLYDLDIKSKEWSCYIWWQEKELPELQGKTAFFEVTNFDGSRFLVYLKRLVDDNELSK